MPRRTQRWVDDRDDEQYSRELFQFVQQPSIRIAAERAVGCFRKYRLLTLFGAVQVSAVQVATTTMMI